MTESDAHDLGTSIWPIGVCEGKNDRIYSTLGNLSSTTLNNGIGYWDEDLKFQKSIVWPSSGLANDCFVTDDHVFFTAGISGEVIS